MATSLLSRTIDLYDLGGVVLRIGDSDLRRVWGGTSHTRTGEPVRQLQSALVAVNCMTGRPDGEFGPNTDKALRRFQWFVANRRRRLQLPTNGAATGDSIHDYVATDVGTPGLCFPRTAAALLHWTANRYVCTTPLVRLGLDSVPHFELNHGFVNLSYPDARPNELLVEDAFASRIIGTMSLRARETDVVLRVNQAFRRSAVPPSGAVVTPATRSQHLVGHALDVNIVDGDVVNTSAMYRAGTASQGALDFIDAVKLDGLRWGGDFRESDPPHFDDHLNPSGLDFGMIFFFAQRCFLQQHPMRTW